MQKNYDRVVPQTVLGPGDFIDIVIYYSGHLLGYIETDMLYVRDKIDTAFSILRQDCGAYPHLGVPSWRAYRAAGLQEFD